MKIFKHGRVLQQQCWSRVAQKLKWATCGLNFQLRFTSSEYPDFSLHESPELLLHPPPLLQLGRWYVSGIAAVEGSWENLSKLSLFYQFHVLSCLAVCFKTNMFPSPVLCPGHRMRIQWPSKGSAFPPPETILTHNHKSMSIIITFHLLCSMQEVALLCVWCEVAVNDSTTQRCKFIVL